MRELREIRIRRGMSQADLHERTGVSEFTISELEAGKRTNPRPSTLRKLAQGLGVEVTDLLGEPELPKAQAPPPPENGGRGSQETAAREEALLRRVEEQDAQLGRKWAALVEASMKQLETRLHTHLELAAQEKDAALAEAHRKLAGEWFRCGWAGMLLLMKQGAQDVPSFVVPEIAQAFDQARERVLEFSQPHPTDLAELEETAEWLEEKPRTRY
ncbi:MAG: helix-turn-helix transcriptional regulator [Actinomycetota bacterium]|nr:helix-turn-helix transcriptional regulator [Actinomycetota bacterium]